MRGWLVLEDGSVFRGSSEGIARKVLGEVVFNTGMTGYQEMLTDPSYTGQILVLCYPLTGNYGINTDDSQSCRVHPEALIVSEACTEPSHWRLSRTLRQYMQDSDVPHLEGVDTRALVRHLRSHGSMKGVLVFQEAFPDVKALAAEASAFAQRNLVMGITVREPYTLEGDGPHIAVVDLGLKSSIIQHLRALNCRVTVVPAFTPAKDILALSPVGVLLSNGPGNPKDLPGVIAEVDCLAGRVPLFGICLGNQVLALAMGADTYKMKFGHRGGNHPVRDLAGGKIFISSQNHGYAVDDESLKGTGLRVIYRNVNDETVEGLEHARLPVLAVQFHPEGGPGPRDSSALFEAFLAKTARSCTRAG